MINLISAECEDGTNLFEIGTCDGRTSLNLALTCPPHCKVYTLDLPPAMQHPLLSAASGEKIEQYRTSHPVMTAKIHRLFGDSATCDFSPYANSCSLVFVDGDHRYDYAMSDTRAAMKMVTRGGIVLWHDYGIFDGVTKALEDIEAREQMGFKNIRGTSLVYWKHGQGR